MDKEVALKEMIETIEEFGQCSVLLSDEDQIVVSPATDYCGGEEGYHMCSELGNIQYDDIERICQDVLELIGDVEIDSVEVD